MDTEALIWWPYSSCALQGQSTTERASGGKMREKKSSVRWPHSDNKPGKSLSLEPFRNSTAVYTGGGWVEQDVQRACILQHLVMNTKHTQHVKSHSHTGIHKHSIPGPRCGLSCDTCSVTSQAVANLSVSCLNFKMPFYAIQEVLSDTTVPGLSSSECSPPRTEASGWLVCLAAGPSPATTSTWLEFNPRGRLQ